MLLICKGYGRIDSSGIVSAGVKQDDRAFGDFGDVLQSARLVEATSGLVVVAVALHVHPCESENTKHMKFGVVQNYEENCSNLEKKT